MTVVKTEPSTVLLLPGWQNSGPGHWQSRWENLHGYRRVEQHDWLQPRRGDWCARLEEVILTTPISRGPLTLVAHSLGCLLVAAWAAHSLNTHRVRAALLVAPPDTTDPAIATMLPGWAASLGSAVLQKLPFNSCVMASRNDPYCPWDQALAFAQAWGSSACIDCGLAGHLNTDSALGDWPQAHALLLDLQGPT